MNGGSIALFNTTDAMKWKTTAMPMLYKYMYGRTKLWLLFLDDVDLPWPANAWHCCWVSTYHPGNT